jgi:hypothetical protein
MSKVIRSFMALVIFASTYHYNLQAQSTQTNVAELNRVSNSYQLSYQLNKSLADSTARLQNMPIRFTTSFGVTYELVRIDGNIPIYYATENSGAAVTSGATQFYSGGLLGLALYGSGYSKLGEWDGGAVLTSHQEFGSRVTQGDSPSSTSDHATHVAGTMVASGVDADAKGMAYGANLEAYDWNSDDAEMAAAAALGMEISNHSYSSVTGWAYGSWSGSDAWHWFGDTTISETEDYRFGLYTSSSQSWDNIAYNAPYYLIVKSAGNDRGDTYSGAHYIYNNGWILSNSARNTDGGSDGFDCIPSKGIAKNILTVGAAYQVTDYQSNSDVTISTFSGYGPADDGRIKPDIVAKGVSVYSAGSASTTTYTTKNGTSMSSPSVAGTLVLLQELYGNTHASASMKSATLKGLVLHTADEAGNNPGPDYRFGWGLINAEEAARVIIRDTTSGMNVIDERTLKNDSVYTREITVSGNEPLVVSICWTDPAATPPSASLNPSDIMLVSDLDLKVIKDGTTYYPWKLDKDNPSYKATRNSENKVDNIEIVRIDNPTSGTYTIQIDHDGTLSSDQDYSLIISGISEYSNPPTSCSSELISPSDGASNVALSTDIKWNEVCDAESYIVYFGTDGNGSVTPTNIKDQVEVFTNQLSANLLPDSTYYLQIIPKNSAGRDTCTTIYSFSTETIVINSTFPYTEDFDAFTAIGTGNTWEDETTDDFNWTVYSGSTPSSYTGPTSDHTSGAGKYLYIEATGNNPSKRADIYSPYFNMSALSQPTLSLWYHMWDSYEAYMGNFAVDIYDNGKWNNGVHYLSGNQGNEWKVMILDLSNYNTDTIQRIRIRFTTGSNWPGDFAIDDFKISDGLTNTWTGTTSTNFNVATNWSEGFVPNSTGIDILIPTTPSGGVFPVLNSPDELNINSISIQSTASTSLTVNSGARLVVNGSFEILSGGSISNEGEVEILGDWNNAGSYSSSNGCILFSGDAGQNITDASGQFEDLVVNSNVTLNNNIEVNGTLELRNGQLLLGNYNVSLDANADIQGDLSEWNMIITNGTGEFRKYISGNGTYLLPIGDNEGSVEYSPASITFNSGSYSSAYISAQVINQKHSSNLSASDYLNRYWEISTNGVSSPDYDIELTYTQSDVVGTEANIKFIKSESGAWNELAAVNANSNLLNSSSLSSFSIFTGGDENQDGLVLSVELASFDLICQNKGVLIEWVSLSELNSQYYLIEKMNEKGEYITLTKVASNGNSLAMIHYSYYDEASSGAQVYRLSEIDNNGRIQILATQSIDCGEEDNQLLVYPNPTSGLLYIERAVLDHTETTIFVYNSNGILIESFVLKEQFVLDTQNYPSGLYYLRSNQTSNQPVKFIVH